MKKKTKRLCIQQTRDREDRKLRAYTRNTFEKTIPIIITIIGNGHQKKLYVHTHTHTS
jgi:hypothetical protein